MKLIRNSSVITAIFPNSEIIVSENLTMAQADEIMAARDDEKTVRRLLAEATTDISTREKIKEDAKIVTAVESKSKVLSYRGDAVYWPQVAEHSMPTSLVSRIIEAEVAGNKEAIQKYKNFWTWACLNPDARARHNMFWFLDKWGMELTQSGLIIAYRNAKLKTKGAEVKAHKYTEEETVALRSMYAGIVKRKLDTSALYVAQYSSGKFYAAKEPQEAHGNLTLDAMLKTLDSAAQEQPDIYTDVHSGTTTIILGQPVAIPRENCDANQENSCSRGLHVGAKKWLTKGYFGNDTFVCLINPADVVAVPTIDNYGKMRTCRYLPLTKAKFTEGKIDSTITDGFEDSFITSLASEYKEQGADGNYKIVCSILKQNESKLKTSIADIVKQNKARTIQAK